MERIRNAGERRSLLGAGTACRDVERSSLRSHRPASRSPYAVPSGKGAGVASPSRDKQEAHENVTRLRERALPARTATGSRSAFGKRNKPMGNPIGLFLVRKTGLEPVQCELHAPQTCASASSATSAYKTPFIYYTEKVSEVLFGISAANI